MDGTAANRGSRFERGPIVRLMAVLATLSLSWSVAVGAQPTIPQGGYTVTDFGAKADGKTDDTAAIQKALDAAAATGGTVTLPPGQYVVAGSLRVPTGVMLAGSWQMPHHGEYQVGTALLVTGGRGTESGPAAIELAQSSGVRGLTILYPDQVNTNVVPYPWTIHGTGMHNTVEDVTLVNSYNGIAIGPESNELHLIRNVYGCVLRRGVFVDSCTDIGRIENVHFNPHYWTRSGHPGAADMGPTLDYMRKHLDAFIFGRTDWQYCTNTFVYGAKVGYRFIKTKNGACNGQFLGIAADGGEAGVMVEGMQPFGILITNGQFVSFGGDCIVTTPEYKAGSLQLVNCSFWGPIRHIANLQGAGAVFMQQCNMWQYEQAAINAQAGEITVTASRFNAGGPALALGEKVRAAVFTGNTTIGKAQIENPFKVKVQAGNNAAVAVEEGEEE